MTDLREALDTLMFGDGPPPRAAGLIVMCPEMKAIYEAQRVFYGRDRRRIKRETRKALKALGPRHLRMGGIDRGAGPFWRNQVLDMPTDMGQHS